MDPQDPRLDQALLRGLTQRRISRRDALRYAGMGLGAAGLTAFLASCGVGSSSAAAGSSSPATFDWSAQQLNHQLNFANWPYYIDTSHGTHPIRGVRPLGRRRSQDGGYPLHALR